MTTREYMRLLRLALDPLPHATAGVSHEDVFLELYGRLRRRVLTLTGQDHGLAKDLLHDAFIQFTLGRRAASIEVPSRMLRPRRLPRVG